MSKPVACSSPPEVTDEQISFYLDGDKDAAFIDHISRCPYCRNRLEAARQFDIRIKAALNRYDCPTPLELTNYHMGLLNSHRSREIERHLTICIACGAELEALEAFMNNDDRMEQQAVQRPVIQTSMHPYQVATVVRVEAGAMRGRRGNRIKKVRVTVDEGLSISLEFRQSAPDYLLIGELIAEEDTLAQWEGATVFAHQGSNLLAAASVDDLGYFKCQIEEIDQIRIHIVAENGQSVLIPDNALTEPDG